MQKSLVIKLMSAVFAAALLTGCCAPRTPRPATPKEGCCAGVVGSDGMVRAAMALPSSGRDAQVVRLERMYPAKVTLDDSFEYKIMVTNVIDCAITDVTVNEEFASNFTFQQADPAATSSEGGMATWDLGTLKAGESTAITVTGTANAVENIRNCATVTWNRECCMQMNVINPKLSLDKSLPSDVLLCDMIPITLTVTNSGTGAAENVTVTDQLPDGMVTEDGRSSVTFDAGTLDSGQSREFQLSTKATRTGVFRNTATASGKGGLSAEAEGSVTVTQPVLSLKKKVTQEQLVGRNVTAEITVANVGDAPAENVMLVDTLPAGTEFVSASHGGTVKPDGKVTWNVAEMGPKTQSTVNLVYTADRTGDLVNRVSANARCADATSARATTKVTGIPAVLLEVIDVEDPVPVGKNETYVITATNQGSAISTNITITCMLEEGLEYVSSSGPTSATVDGERISFGPLKDLAPKNSATWRVEIKGTTAGDKRFRVRMTSDYLDRPVEETESTHMY